MWRVHAFGEAYVGAGQATPDLEWVPGDVLCQEVPVLLLLEVGLQHAEELRPRRPYEEAQHLWRHMHEGLEQIGMVHAGASQACVNIEESGKVCGCATDHVVGELLAAEDADLACDRVCNLLSQASDERTIDQSWIVFQPVGVHRLLLEQKNS